jgi:hypothetical protein
MMERERMKLELKEEQIIEILLHAATREDIAKLDTKIETKIDKLDAKVDRLHAETKNDIAKVDAKIDKVIWFILVSILVPIILHFVK